MSDDSASTDTIIVIIPPALRAQYPDLIELILRSESMNNAERQYWVDLLPMMSPEKIEELRKILLNERDQLAAIDTKYEEDIKKTSTVSLQETETQRTKKREELSSRENAEQTEAEKKAEDILKEME